MRVCHVTVLHPRNDQRILFKECRSLARAGYDVHLIAPPAEREPECPGVTMHTGPRLTSKLRVLGCTWKVFRLARRDVRADVYHFHDFWLIPFGLAVRWFTRVAAVYDVHEEYGRASARALERRKWVPRFIKKLLEKTVGAVEAFAARRLDHVITVVDSISERFRAATSRVTEVRNYVRPDILPSAPPGREAYLARRPVIVHHGGLATLRGRDLMLRTMRVLQDRGVDCTLWAVDRFLGEQGAREEFLSRVRELDIADRVELRPPVMYEELHQYLAHARLGLSLRVMPTDYEGSASLSNIPTKLFEYMGFALPIVANDVDFHTTFLAESGAGIVTEYEEHSVADAVARLLANPDEAYDMGCRGFRTYREKYTWDSQEKCLLEAYRQIAERRGRSREGSR